MFASILSSAWMGSKTTPSEADEEFSEEEELFEDEVYEISEKILRERKALKQRNETLKAQLNEAKAMLSERPPVWIPDSDRLACVNCAKPFTLFNRRHHCRACGEVFDATCSSNSKELSFYPNAGPQRVCDSCYVSNGPIGSDVLNCTALLALGIGPLSSSASSSSDESVLITDSPLKITRTVKKTVRKTRKAARRAPAVENVQQVAAGTTSQSGKRRSEIPPPPPFPTTMPKLINTAPLAGILKQDPSKKTSKPFVPPQSNIRRIDMVELQEGIARLRKATPRTPAKVAPKKDDAFCDLRNSLRRRRKCLEDSVVSLGESNQENLPNSRNVSAEKTASKDKGSMSVIDGLKDTLVFKESPVPIMNSSWLE